MFSIASFNPVEALLANNSGDKVHIISDNTRFENVANVTCFNDRSGEQILRYVRGQQLDKIPVLIGSLSSANALCVKQFELAGSTNDTKIAENFIASMVAPVENFHVSTWAVVDASY